MHGRKHLRQEGGLGVIRNYKFPRNRKFVDVQGRGDRKRQELELEKEGWRGILDDTVCEKTDRETLRKRTDGREH